MIEKISSKWWFYFVALLIAFVPPITQKSISPEQTSLVIKEVLQNPIIHKAEIFYPVS